MLQKPKECEGCELYTVGRAFSNPSGSSRASIIGIGEALGDEEAWRGRPFIETAQAGGKLEECLKLVGITREDIKLWNICACQPMNPKNSLAGRENAIEHCKVHFDRVVLGHDPASGCGKRVILAMGSLPTRTLVANCPGVSEWRGFVFEAKRKRYVESAPTREGELVGDITTETTEYGLCVPTFHPSYIKRGNPELTPLLAFDIKRALEVASGKFTSYPLHSEFCDLSIYEFPNLDDAWSFYNYCKSNSGLVISVDIETPKTGFVPEEERGFDEPAPIIQIQFSVNTREAIVFPWKEPYIEVALAILDLPNMKAGHFVYGFDLARLKDAGAKIGGKAHDSMWMFKHWHPRLPRGLQNVASMAGYPYPWKHYFMDRLQWYGGHDVIAVQYILRWLPPLMKKLGIWQGYLDAVFHEYYILQGAADRGMPVNDAARVELRDTLKAERREIHKELQQLIPDEIKGVEPKRKQENGAIDYGYKSDPKKLLDSAKAAYSNWAGNTECDFETYLREYLVFRTKDGKNEFRLKQGDFPCIDAETGEERVVRRWYREMLFKASSSQLIRYLEWKRESLLNGA